MCQVLEKQTYSGLAKVWHKGHPYIALGAEFWEVTETNGYKCSKFAF